MNDAQISTSTAAIGFNTQVLATKALNLTAQLAFLVAIVGQLIFVVYIVSFYGGSYLADDLQQWNTVLGHGQIKGDSLGNAAVMSHIAFAAIIHGFGPLQFIPQLRTKAPRFHHWNGRLYLLTGVITAITGVYMMISRGTVGNDIQHLGTGINGVLIVIFAALTIRFAIGRNIRRHRRWALRLFMAISGVWFFRVGLMFWLTVNGGPVGFDMKTFTGPFLEILAYAQYALPLLLLELYFRGQDTRNSVLTFGAAGLLLVGMGVMLVGIFAATMGMWLPRI